MTTIDKIVQSQSTNKERCLLPTVFTVEKGHPVPAKAPGPGSVYVIEGIYYVHDLYVILMTAVFRRAANGGCR